MQLCQPSTVTVPATGLMATSFLPSPRGWLANAAVNRLAAPGPALLASACETRSARAIFSVQPRSFHRCLGDFAKLASKVMLLASTFHKSLFD
jgi:hypothetical protein